MVRSEGNDQNRLVVLWFAVRVALRFMVLASDVRVLLVLDM